jgi:anti-anti-sigma factor
MLISSQLSGQTYQVSLSDRMTFADHHPFRALIHDINTSGATSCVLDLSQLTAIDSAGLGMFVIAIEAGNTSGWKLTLKSPRPQVKQLLLLAKFDKLVTVTE